MRTTTEQRERWREGSTSAEQRFTKRGTRFSEGHVSQGDKSPALKEFIVS